MIIIDEIFSDPLKLHAIKHAYLPKQSAELVKCGENGGRKDAKRKCNAGAHSWSHEIWSQTRSLLLGHGSPEFRATRARARRSGVSLANSKKGIVEERAKEI